jgi:hypothetical protein
VARQEAQGVRAFSLPKELFAGDPLDAVGIQSLADEIVQAFRFAARVILHVGLPPVEEVTHAAMLTAHLVRVAEEVLHRTEVRHVFAEGGATAVALARQMGWDHLQVSAEVAPGVVTLSIPERNSAFFTMKPGSYVWPEP